MDLSYLPSKIILDSGHITSEQYNNDIVTPVQQGIIKDITPKNYIMAQYQVVGAIVELPDGSRYRIAIFNPPDLENPDNLYNYYGETSRYHE